MLNCIKPEAGRFIIRSVLASLLLCPTVLYADLTDGFIVENAQLKLGETEYVIDADIQYHFSQEVLKALEHGIALQIDIEIQISIRGSNAISRVYLMHSNFWGLSEITLFLEPPL